MSLIFEKAIACAEQIEKRFRETGEVTDILVDEKRGIRDLVFTSPKYRRAHISIVDAREDKKLWLLHVTIFPHVNHGGPIYGFDIIAGPNKVSGAFHDFSCGGVIDHNLSLWFETFTYGLTWNKKRELPDWAKQIFSDGMVAIGAVGADELDAFTSTGLETLDYYLSKIGENLESKMDFRLAQNRYCRYQKQNQHTPRVLISLGFTEQEAEDFVQNNLFPEIE